MKEKNDVHEDYGKVRVQWDRSGRSSLIDAAALRAVPGGKSDRRWPAWKQGVVRLIGDQVTELHGFHGEGA